MTAEDLRQRALRLLAQRDHTRAELLRKLASHGTREQIDAVIERLSELGLQSDQRFAEQFVRSRGARFGAQRLRHELKQRGVDRELSEQAIESELPDDEFGRARRIRRDKFGAMPSDAREWAQQARFLQYRGFSAELIHRLLKEAHDEPA